MCLIVLLLLAAGAEDLYRRGLELFGKGQREEAVRLFARAAAADPQHAQAWKALGVAYSMDGNHEMAAEPLAAACRLQPRLDDACFYHARNLYARNQFEASLAALEQARRIDVRPWRIAHAQAQALEALGRATEAERVYRDAIRLAAERTVSLEDDARLSYGIFLFRQGRAGEALSWLEQAHNRHPKSTKALFELGRALYQLDRLEEAAARLNEALLLDPSHLASRLLLDKTARRLKAR